MPLFSVEVTLERAKTEDDWAALRRMTDTVPGTLLLEDPEEPVLIFPVESNHPQDAAVFVQGVASIAGLNIISGVLSELPDDHESDAQRMGTTEEGFRPQWLCTTTG